jgi:hypothetical protein
VERRFPDWCSPGKRLPDQYDRPWACTVTALLSIFTLHRQLTCHRSQVRPVCTIGRYCQNWLLISSEKWTAQTTIMLSSYFRPICACVRWRTQTVLCNQLLIQTDSLAQPRKLLCFKVSAMCSQCKVFVHLNYIHKISPDKVQYNQQIYTRTEHNGESNIA